MIKALAFGLMLAASAAPARASLANDIATCIGIRDDKSRLACFDAAAKLMVSRMESDPTAAILERFKKREPTEK